MSSKVVKVKDVRTSGGKLTVGLSDGRMLALPLLWYPSLAEATAAERAAWQPCGAGQGIHWPAIDYYLDVEGLLAGCREVPTALAYTRRFRKQGNSRRKLLHRAKRSRIVSI